jgi:hypothetical protein
MGDSNFGGYYNWAFMFEYIGKIITNFEMTNHDKMYLQNRKHAYGWF